MALVSVVIPCYKSATTIAKVVMLTVDELESLGFREYEFLLVNDCSPDNGKTINELYRLADEYGFVRVINLGKNSGQHNSTLAGLNFARGDLIVSMDDDMQTHPSQLPVLVAKLNEGYDIVYGYYEEKKESLFRRMGSTLNHLTVRFLIHKPAWLRTSSYWIIRKYVRDYAIQYRHYKVHLQGLFLRITDNIACVPIEHFNREVGGSTYTLKKLVHQYSSILGFSVVPIKLVAKIGFLFALFGFGVDFILLIRKVIDPSYAQGWISIVATVCFFSGIILIALGIVGLYIGNILLGETNTPQYVVRDTRNFDTTIDHDCLNNSACCNDGQDVFIR